MTIQDVENTVGLEKPSDDIRPLRQIRQPAENAHSCVYDVELFIQHARQVVEVGTDESGIQLQFIIQCLR